jgi:hypothetical protein
VQRIIEALITKVADVRAGNVIRLVYALIADWRFVPGRWKHVIRYAHFDVVRFTGEDRE